MYQSLPSTSSRKPAAPRPQQPKPQGGSWSSSANNTGVAGGLRPAQPVRPQAPTARPQALRSVPGGQNPVQRQLPGVPTATPSVAPKPTLNPSMIGTSPSPQMGTPVQGSMLPATMPQQNQALMFDPNSSPADHPEGIVGWMRDRDAYRAAQGQAQSNGQQGILTGFSGGATTTFDPALVARIMKQRGLQTAPQIAPMA